MGYNNMNIRGKEGRVSSESTISKEELYDLWNNATEQEKFIIASAGYAGMRDNEYLHLEPSWIHFSDSITKKYGDVPLIRIPGATKKFKQLCNCADCELRAYRQYRKKKADEENDDKHVKHNAKWYAKVSRDFYELPIISPKKSKKDKLILSRLSKKHELTDKQKSKIEEIEKKYIPSRIRELGIQGFWRPKSVSGSRIIPLILEDVQEVFKNYKENYDQFRLKKKRLDAWWSVKKLGKKILHKDIFPHSLRATYISILADHHEMTANKLIKLSGHKSAVSLDPYINTERKESVRVAKKISRDLFR